MRPRTFYKFEQSQTILRQLIAFRQKHYGPIKQPTDGQYSLIEMRGREDPTKHTSANCMLRYDNE